ncbi:cytochrome P450 [Kitasatospora sp. NBC_01266]|uniref:cytochrome P450 n=1 Tax=Kitasatospora sp. NBC_01266 TaxID=2903572 RepID=UPI002E31EF10|nr:cytochrome P450 [Kitasatospora sp. NBC_01266]
MTVAPHYDPLDPAMLEDPYQHYADLRENHPIFWHEGMKSWVVTRYQDCRDVLRNNELFARDRRRVGEEIPEFRQSLQTLDPPSQAPLRSLIMNAFRAQDLDAVGRRARGRIQQLFKDLAERDSFDWMSEVAAPVALSITADLLGVPEPDPGYYAEISEGIAQRMDAGLKPANIEQGDRARNQLNALAEEWFAGEDRPGVLKDIKDRAAEARMPMHYISNSTGMMFNASYGTVFATAGNAVLTLLQHPWALERLRDERLLGTGVDELVRYDGPAQGTSRVATRTTEIQGTTIEPGQIVLTLLAAANRDPREFPRPDELVLDRTPNRHLGFGWGTHACVGAMFGRVAVRELIVCLLAAPQRLRLAGEPTRRPTATVRSPGLFPVTFDR